MRLIFSPLGDLLILGVILGFCGLLIYISYQFGMWWYESRKK